MLSEVKNMGVELFTKRQNLDWSKFRAIADDKINLPPSFPPPPKKKKKKKLFSKG